MPAGARNITKKAIACSPVQADNEGRSSQNSHPLLETGPSSATESPIPVLLLYPPRGKHPLSWFLDILLTMSVQNLKGLTQSEADTEIRGWNQTSDNSQRRSGLREQFRFSAAEELYRPKSWLHLDCCWIYSTWTSRSCLRGAQYCDWPLGVTASPVTYYVELIICNWWRINFLMVYFQFKFREGGLEIRFRIYT